MPKPMKEVRNSKNITAMLLIDLVYAIYSHTNAGKYIGVWPDQGVQPKVLEKVYNGGLIVGHFKAFANPDKTQK